MVTRRCARLSRTSACGGEGWTGFGYGWYGAESEWYGDRPDLSGSLRRWEMASLRARDGLEIVGSCRDITADLTRTYSGRCIEVNGTGLGERSIESLWRIQLSI